MGFCVVVDADIDGETDERRTQVLYPTPTPHFQLSPGTPQGGHPTIGGIRFPFARRPLGRGQ